MAGVNFYYNAPGTAPGNLNELLWGVANGTDPSGALVTQAKDVYSASQNTVYQQAAKQLGIKTIDSQNDLNQLNALIFGGGGTGVSNQANTSTSTGSGSIAGDSSGTMSGITGALNNQAQAGQNMAQQQLTDQQMLQMQLGAMQYQNQQVAQQFQQMMAQQFMAQQAAAQQMAQQMQAQQANQAQQMQLQQQQMAQYAQQMQAQTQAAMASAAEQRRQADALARAYVPPPKETVGFAPVGDLRSPVASSREGSLLSDLSLLPGTQTLGQDSGLLNTLILA